MIPYRERWHRSEGGVYTRAPHMMGMGMGVGFSSPPPWTPAAVPGCILYGGGYREDRAVRAAQYTLVNGNFEGAAGPAGWTAFISTISREAGARTGGTGQYVGRVAHSGTAVGAMYQELDAGANGLRFGLSGWVRGINGAIPEWSDGGVGGQWVGVAGDWQQMIADYTQTFGGGFYPQLICRNLAAGRYIEGDDIAITVLSLQSYTPAYTTIPGSVLAQATATAQPWVSSDGLGIRFQNDAMVWSAAASALKCMHDGTGGTFGFTMRASALPAISWLASTIVNFNSVGFAIAATNANQIRCMIGNGSGVYDYDSGLVACPIAINTRYAIVIRVAAGAGGIKVNVNKAPVISGALTAPSAADPTNQLAIGSSWPAGTSGIDGIEGHPWVVNRSVTDAEMEQYTDYVLAQATL